MGGRLKPKTVACLTTLLGVVLVISVISDRRQVTFYTQEDGKLLSEIYLQEQHLDSVDGSEPAEQVEQVTAPTRLDAEMDANSERNLLLGNFSRRLKSVRKQFLRNEADWSVCSRKVFKKVLASSTDFFQQLSKSNIHVESFSISRTELASVLRPRYYDFTSNVCDTVETNSKGSGKFLESFYNASCLSQLEEAYDGQPLEVRREHAMRITLPRKSNQFSDNVLLTFLAFIDNAVIDMNGDIRGRDVDAVPMRCRDTWVYGPFNRSLCQSAPVFDEVFSASQFFGKQFYHATLECLVRLAPFLPFLRDNPTIKLHLGYYHPFLGLLGISKDRIVTGRVRAKVAYMPTGGGCGTTPLFAAQVLSDELRKNLDVKERNTIVLIKRSRDRAFKFHDQINQMLQRVAKDFGLSVSIFSDSPLPSLNQTAAVFSRALIVISPHGAGASNMLFSAPGTVLLEALHPGPQLFPNLCFASMAQALGLRYHGLFKNTGVPYTRPEDMEEVVRFFLLKIKGS